MTIRTAYADKIATARFYFDRLLPQGSGLFAAIMAGGASITEFREAAFKGLTGFTARA